MIADIASTLSAELWRKRRPAGPPVAHMFRDMYADRWVRFHSLPGSQRYPQSASEYATVLERYNTVLDELFESVDLFVVTMDWSETPTGSAGSPTRAALHPEGVRWWIESDRADPDPEFHVHARMYADRRRWVRGCVDALLRAVADYELADVFFTDTRLQRIHHPYDGGADVILATTAERDRLRDRHAGWLSSHPSGL